MKTFSRMEKGVGKSKIEDRLLINHTVLAGGTHQTVDEKSDFSIFAIADGVGGNSSGNVAAQIALNELSLFNPDELNEQVIKNEISRINYKIVSVSKSESSFHNMATTLTGVCNLNGKWFVFHVGNTRVYIWKKPYLTQISTDHSWSREMHLMGYSDLEIKNSGRTNEITACLGNGTVSSADKLQVEDISKMMQGAEMILLTSDGVHEYISENILENTILSVENVDGYLEQVMSYVRNNHSNDDLSIAWIELK